MYRKSLITMILMLAASLALLGQTSSASLSGTVQDSQGALVPGATVKALDIRTNQEFETITGEDGNFSFPTLQPGTYTITVEMPGFKKLVKTGVILNVADRQSTGTLTLDVGEIADTISVTAEGSQMQIKTTSGEMGDVIIGRQVQELALNGRNYLDLLKIVPGVVSTTSFVVAGPGGFGNISINGTRQNQHNLTLDGSTNVDTGSNGTQHVMLNIDAIAEFKVLTSNYQAEYGRSAGGDIRIVTRSGGSDFHGTAYLFHRHEGLNSNTFFNNADGRRPDGTERNARSLYRYNFFGYNIGGPIVLPKEKLKDKLFFFWGQEWHRQLTPTFARQHRMPTTAEVNGDFSATLDGNRVPITITDPLTGKPFSGNRIPAGRFNQSGQNILKLFNRFANSPESLPLFNHNSQESSGYPRRQENIRIDYRLSESTTVFGRFTQDTDTQILPYGVGWTSGQNFPLTPTIFKQGPARNAALNITTTISPTLVNEFIFGPSQNNLTLDPTDADAATMKGIGLTFKPAFPYNPVQFVNITFGGTPNQSFGGITSYSQFPYKNSNTTFDFIDNISKVWGNHTVKAGIFVQRNRKDQAAGASMGINFNHNTRNPNNAGHPFANALLGEFDSLSNPTKSIFQGQYRNTNVEWFVQDNWKFTSRLTFDYGMRFYWIQPQYDARLQAGYFNPKLWDPAKAVRLYRPGPGNAFAIDPANPSVRLPSFLIGRIVPGSGDPFNGMGFAGASYLRAGIEDRGVHFGPRLGFAYDIFGDGKTIIRGGYGLFYDRVSGNTLAFPGVGQPPFFVNPVFNWGNLDTFGTSTGEVALAPFGVIGADPAGHVPTVHNFSLQIQRDIGFDTVLSVGYVGSTSSHLAQRRNLNYIPLGTLFTKAAQDPTRFTGGVVPDSDPTIPQIYKDAGLKFDGSKALSAEFLRPYPGYLNIGFTEGSGSSNYHSMQVTAQRKFAETLTYAVAYTFGRTMDTANGDTEQVQSPTDIRRFNYRRASFDRRHILAINYIWNLPRLSERLGNHWLAKGVFDGWELSGISQFISGSPTELGFGIQPSSPRSITGSPDFPARFILTGDPTGSRTREQWFDPAVFRLPDIGSDGFGPRTYLSNPGLNVHDISIFKNFALPGGDESRRLQIRFEMFNAFNHPSFSGFNGGLTWNLASNWSDYKDKQQFNQAWVRNTRTGVNPASGRLGRALGEVNGLHSAGAGRVIQLAAKFYF